MKHSIQTTVVLLGLITSARLSAQPTEPPAERPPEFPAEEPVPPATQDPAGEGPSEPAGDAPAKQAPAAASAEAEKPVEPAQTQDGSSAEQASETALLAELQNIESAHEERGVTLSGFMDFNLRHTFKADPLLQSSDTNDSFYIGSLNVYFRGNINARLRSLVELRFTYLPNGVADGQGDFERTSTSDYADHGRRVNLGSIEIERAHGEYEFDQALIVRAGQFLTPYGVWNVDHGSPSVISVTIPYAIGQGLIPERQTGFELLGSVDLSDAIQLRHHLTLSNGRGPFDSHYDLDDNKAVGGRVQLALQSDFGDLSVGASSYYGRYTDARVPDQTSGIKQITRQYDELALAGDAKWSFKGFHFQTEFVHQQVAYTEAGRRRLDPDGSNWGAYAIAGYRVPVVEVMPFIEVQSIDDEIYDLSSYGGGLNFRPFPELVLKAQATVTRAQWESIKAESTRLDTQIAWAF